MWIYDSTRECRSNKHITVAFPHLSQPLAGRFISQVNVAQPIFTTSLTNTLALLRALSACCTQHAHTPPSEHLRERESCHTPTASWKIPIRSNTSLLRLRERETNMTVCYQSQVMKTVWVIFTRKIQRNYILQ